MKTPLVVIALLLMSAVWLGGCSASRTIAPIVVAPNNRVEIAVTRMGFEPERVQVTHGQPVTLVVTRTTDMTCATEMVMPSHGIRMALPLNTPVEVSFPCDSAGTMTFTCGMGMVSGAMVAR